MEGVPKKFGKMISSGSERAVYEHDKDPENKVVTEELAIRPEKIKEIFYIQRVLSSLYPERFPRFPEAIVDEEGEGYVTRKKIKEKWKTKFVRSLTEYTSRTENLHSFDSFKAYGRDEYVKIFSKINAELYSLGLDLSFDYSNHNNFMKDKETNLWNYVDVPVIKQLPSSEELEENLQSQKPDVDGNTLKTVTTSIERIRTLREQTVQNLIADLIESEVSETSFVYKGRLIQLTGKDAARIPNLISKFKDSLGSDQEAAQKALLDHYNDVEETSNYLYLTAKYYGQETDDNTNKTNREAKSSNYEIRSIAYTLEELIKVLQETEVA